MDLVLLEVPTGKDTDQQAGTDGGVQTAYNQAGKPSDESAYLLGRPLTLVTIAFLLAGGGVTLLMRQGSELLPPSDQREFSLRLICPPGQRVEATARVVETVEQILGEAAGEDRRALYSEVGRLPDDYRLIREEQTEENTARVIVRLAAGG